MRESMKNKRGDQALGGYGRISQDFERDDYEALRETTHGSMFILIVVLLLIQFCGN